MDALTPVHGPKLLFSKGMYPDDLKQMIIRPIADIHYGHPAQNKRLLKETIEEIRYTDNMYWVNVGDTTENNGKKQPHNGVFHDTLPPDAQLEQFMQDFDCIKHKMLAIIEGNHDIRPKKDHDISIVKWMARAWGVEDRYVTDGALLHIEFGKVTRLGGRRQPGGKTKCSYDLYLTHGSSTSAITGGKASALQKMGDVVIADVYVGGHTHAEMIFNDRIYYRETNDKRQVSYRDRWYVNTGSFLEYDGYALTGRMRPQRPGCPYIVLDGTREVVKVTSS